MSRIGKYSSIFVEAVLHLNCVLNILVQMLKLLLPAPFSTLPGSLNE
ncbi:MAG: hypothetical protein IM333_04420 [Microcystis sp. M048S1]|nr:MULTISPECIES: hypothetical protein [unclassified Microcystis]MCA2725615.1 hypothetical protein [Microcystis sp. M166S2]MCA2781852.1 hypothetical protein [Microcystis sp. M136S2]MCA2784423.1 hypothetical protein [Microcystis sp. M125S2]MCA2793968.1 hypothetical protein [Microcystis sp. M112S2]MCA2802284.1 hypothetical protein [Microcystis sp. M113S2]MCA2892234.1 hypothetical protein [Microcystis sp. M048S1]